MRENESIDQSVLAESVSEKIEYDFIDYFLVKPLDVVKVTKQFTKPVSKNPAEKDANGIQAIDYDTVETEVKEVDSDFRKGIVLKVPYTYTSQLSDNKERHLPEIHVGNVVVFKDTAGTNFDLLKDSKLIRYYDIVAIVK